MLKSTALVDYIVYVKSVKCSAKCSRWLIGNGHTMVGLLPFRVGNEWKDSCSVHEGQSFLYWFKGTYEVQNEETR